MLRNSVFVKKKKKNYKNPSKDFVGLWVIRKEGWGHVRHSLGDAPEVNPK